MSRKKSMIQKFGDLGNNSIVKLLSFLISVK